MKKFEKFTSLILIILFLMCINHTVYANKALEIFRHEAIVTNKNGAICYREDGVQSGDKIDYGTKVTVSWMATFKSEVPNYAYLSESAMFEQGALKIKLADIEIIDNEDTNKNDNKNIKFIIGGSIIAILLIITIIKKISKKKEN